ncbi:MAG: MATE family efflux transporter, partial [Clostridiales bacterium]|nr:MATE family efflux transporter [Clostridiales bacterium]
ASLCMFGIAEGLSVPFSKLFTGYDAALYRMTRRGFLLYSFSFLFAGFNIFGSSFFTALSNGLVSAVISFLRTLLFQVVAVLTLPLIWGINGIWISIVAADAAALVVTTAFMLALRRKYGY